MHKPSRIDLYIESLIMWAATGRICEDVYFTLRHYCFRLLAAINCRWLPFIREAEKELKPYDRQLRPGHTTIERASLGRRWPLFAFMIPVVLPLLLGVSIKFPLLVPATSLAQNDSIGTLASYLGIMAGVLATFTGLLLAVIALTVQVKTSNLAGADFLINALVRRRGFLPIAAFLSGTVLTALLGVVLSNCLTIATLNNYTCAVAGLSAFSLWALFDLLRRTMQTLGTSELDELLSSELISLLRASFRNTLRQALFQKSFSEALEAMGFARHATNEVQEGHPTGYWLKKTGKIVAIDPGPLARIAKILGASPLEKGRNTDIIFTYRPEEDAPYITIQSNGEVTRHTQLALITKESSENRRIGRLLRNALIVGKMDTSNLDWQRIRQLMYNAIERNDGDPSPQISAIACVRISL